MEIDYDKLAEYAKNEEQYRLMSLMLLQRIDTMLSELKSVLFDNMIATKQSAAASCLEYKEKHDLDYSAVSVELDLMCRHLFD